MLRATRIRTPHHAVVRRMAAPCRNAASIARPHRQLSSCVSRSRQSLSARAFATNMHPPSTTTNEQEMDLAEYHKIADRTLEDYQEEMSKMQDTVEDLDMEYGMGVLTVKLGRKGTYVINKQPPMRQIWLSSPVSGPKKYSYETKKRVWQNLRDGHALCELLSKELTQLSGTQLRLKDPEV